MVWFVAKPEVHQLCPILTGEVLPCDNFPGFYDAGIALLASDGHLLRQIHSRPWNFGPTWLVKGGLQLVNIVNLQPS